MTAQIKKRAFGHPERSRRISSVSFVREQAELILRQAQDDGLARLKERRGSALIIVLWALLLLGMVVFGVVDIVELSVEHTTHSQHALQARGLALSGLALGLNPQLLRDDPLLHQTPTATQNFVVTIQSEGARLNLNHILRTNHREILVNLFTQWGMKIDQAQSVADCMYDWVTPGDLKSLNGAKANDYIQANLPQRPTYKAFVDFDEVKLVMNAGALDKVKSNWEDSFTLWSSGPLNVNEAPPELIAAVFSLDPKRVTFFTDERNGRDKIAGTSDDVPVTSSEVFAGELGIGTTTLTALASQISLRDANRRIESVGQADGTQVTLSVVTRLSSTPIEYFLWSEQ